MILSPNQTYLSIFEGSVLSDSKSGSLILERGQSVIAKAGKAPRAKVLVQPSGTDLLGALLPTGVDYRPTDLAGSKKRV